jgi:hypothetical protein
MINTRTQKDYDRLLGQPALEDVGSDYYLIRHPLQYHQTVACNAIQELRTNHGHFHNGCLLYMKVCKLSYLTN